MNWMGMWCEVNPSPRFAPLLNFYIFPFMVRTKMRRVGLFPHVRTRQVHIAVIVAFVLLRNLLITRMKTVRTERTDVRA